MMMTIHLRMKIFTLKQIHYINIHHVKYKQLRIRVEAEHQAQSIKAGIMLRPEIDPNVPSTFSFFGGLGPWALFSFFF